MRAAALDAQIKQLRKEAPSDGSAAPFPDVDPWEYPINPEAVLNEIASTIRRFIVLEAEQAEACALWVAFTWFIDTVNIAPLAVITAPEAACGKSQLRDVLSKLVCRPLSTNNMKAATLFRIAEKWHPSLMLDEVDLMLKSDDEIINLINAGHHRGASQVWRLVGDNHEPKAFDVWGAKCFAGISLEKIFPNSTLTRSIVIVLRRKLDHEKVDRLRHAEPDLFDTLAAKLARFADDYREQVRRARPVLPSSLNDRAQDNWEPLLAIADIAGGEWPERARHAALKLSVADSLAESSGSELLADIREVFEHQKLSKMSSADLLKALCDDDEKCWST